MLDRTRDERVILVDEADRECGTMEKMAAHQAGELHRAFSVFIYDREGRWLLQKRASGKYHSGGLWSNTCCGHPRPGEDIRSAAQRRLLEEMGLVCKVEVGFQFLYRAELDHGLVEHELDHVFIGFSDAIPVPDEDEVEAWRYLDHGSVEMELQASPMHFTAWFRLCFRNAREFACARNTGGPREDSPGR